MRKKLIALMSALVLCISIIPVGASNSKDSVDAQAVKLLTDLKIMDIDEYSGKFWDNTPVKRREIAQIICNLFDYEPIKDDTPCFNDVGEEYRGYAETVVRNGYMAGYGDGRFGANDYVTENQLLKIFVTILDGGAYAELEGGFPTGYVKIGRKLGLITNANISDEPAKRIDVAEMIYRTLESDIMQITGKDGENFAYTRVEGETFLTERRHIYRYDGVVNMIEPTALDSETGTDEKSVQIDNVFLDDRSGMAQEYLGCSVSAYAYRPDENLKGEIVSVCEALDNVIVDVKAEDFEGIDGFEFSYYNGEKLNKLNISSGCAMIYNGKAIDYDEKRFELEIGEIRLIDNNDDNHYDVAVISNYETVVVDKASEAAEIISARFGAETLELKDNYYTITRSGSAESLGKIGVGEVLLVAKSENASSKKVFKIKTSADRVVGTMEALHKRDGRDYIRVEGNDYRLSNYCKKLSEEGRIPKLNVGDKAQFFLNGYGDVAYYNVNASGISLGYLADAFIEKQAFSSRVGVKIFDESGKFVYLYSDSELKVNGSKVDVSTMNDETAGLFGKNEVVEYTAEEDVLRSITFPKQEYDLNEFSLDDSHEKNGASFYCNAASMIEHKYTLSGSTTIFQIPTDEKEHEEGVNFSIWTGANLTATHTFKLYLYDINIDGEVRCAMRPMVPLSESWIDEYKGTVLVNEVGTALNSEGVEVDSISVMDENGAEVTLIARDESVMRVTVNSIERGLKKGDIIQFAKDANSDVARVYLVHDADAGTDFYKPIPLEESKSNYTVAKGYGQVMRAGSSKITLCCGVLPTETTPLDIDMVVPASGTAMYEYDTARNKIRTITAGEITKGDRVFACVNSANKLRILVVYK